LISKIINSPYALACLGRVLESHWLLPDQKSSSRQITGIGIRDSEQKSDVLSPGFLMLITIQQDVRRKIDTSEKTSSSTPARPQY